MPKRSWLHSFAVDASILGGVGCTSFGAFKVCPPAGFIVLGLILLALGLAAAAVRR